MCAWKLAISLVGRGAELSGKSVIFCCLGSDRADIGKALLRQRHASGDVAGAPPNPILRQKRGFGAPLRPAPHPPPPPRVPVRGPKAPPFSGERRPPHC